MQQYVPIIRNLGVMNQYLISRSLDLGLIEQAKQLKQIDEHLIWLLCHKSAKFDFVAQVAKGSALFVGEGNLSFSLSIAKNQRINPARLTATTFETRSNLSEFAEENAIKLSYLGANVIHGVNASKLSAPFGTKLFNTIIFQFPHAGSRQPINGHNPNFVLVRNFLKSAARQLSSGGKVLISAVDSPHYRDAFQFDKAAEAAGFLPPEEYSFEPDSFSGYTHTVTNEDEGALDHHDHFATWVFEL